MLSILLTFRGDLGLILDRMNPTDLTSAIGGGWRLLDWLEPFLGLADLAVSVPVAWHAYD
jgi:hypothetical protein